MEFYEFSLLCFACIGYLIGSIPFGLLLCQIFGHGDIRLIGSGNIGATNVLRTGNRILAFATLILDSGKGAFSVLATYAVIDFLGPAIIDGHCEGDCDTLVHQTKKTCAYVAGLAAITGHCFPIWLKFKGGKGVATTLGTLLVAAPIAGFIACATWLISAFIGRISSLAALSAMIMAPFAVYYFYGTLESLLTLCISLLVVIKHHENIKRILKGEEPKIGKKKDIT